MLWNVFHSQIGIWSYWSVLKYFLIYYENMFGNELLDVLV